MMGLLREHELLLRAALLRGPAAIEAWDAWRASTDVGALDADSQWLLPLLDRSLRSQGVFADRLVRYHSVYRHNWYTSHLRLRQAEPEIRRLCNLGHPVVLLGGAAMALGHYGAIGTRPFLSVRSLAPGAPLFGIDLDRGVLARTAPLEWRTLHLQMLSPEDQLVDICRWGDAWDSRSRLFPIADAVILSRRHPDLDRAGALGLAARLGCSAPVTAMLRAIDRFTPAIAA